MRFEIVHLKEHYPVLDRNGADPTLEMMIQDEVIADRPRPSMLICPGGGYHLTSDGEAQNIGFEFMTLGFNAFVLRYSVKPHAFPQQLAEAACAVDYIVTHAEELKADPNKTAILGFSAGGHLAASYCTMRDFKELTDLVPEPKPVQAAVLCYPVISAEMPTHLPSFQVLTGKEELSADDIEKLSCEKHVSKETTPPTFIWTTSDDGVVDPVNTLKYATALKNENIQFELHIFPTGYHGLTTGRYGVVNNHKHPMCEYLNVWPEYARRWIRTIFGL